MSKNEPQRQKTIGDVFKNGLFSSGMKKAATGLALAFTLAAGPALAGTPGQLNPAHGEVDFYTQVIKSGQPTLVEFYADWCGYCKLMKPMVQEAARENPNLNVVVVNVDEPANARLTQAFAAKGIPAFIVTDQNGKVASHASGAFSSKGEFKQWLGTSLRK